MEKHTPTPWTVRFENNYYVQGKDRSLAVAKILTDEPTLDIAKANAELIVKAVNAHEALVEACQRAKDYLHTKYPGEADIFAELSKAITLARP
ncbi:MAG: hypothetical protein WKF87_06635 [Chryseolinea sp.]